MGKPSAAAYVYFLRPIGMDGPVKIGCSEWPELRLATLMSWSPFRLEVAARLPGNTDLERRFHARFMADHSHGEWFCPSAALSATISDIQDGVFDLSTLPEPKGIYSGAGRPAWTADQRRAAGWSQRLRRLRDKRVKIPEAVSTARARFAGWPIAGAVQPGNSADAEIVEAFLAAHGATFAREAA